MGFRSNSIKFEFETLLKKVQCGFFVAQLLENRCRHYAIVNICIFGFHFVLILVLKKTVYRIHSRSTFKRLNAESLSH